MKNEQEIRRFAELLKYRIASVLKCSNPSGSEVEAAEIAATFLAPLQWVLEDKDAEGEMYETMEETIAGLAELKDEDVSRN